MWLGVVTLFPDLVAQVAQHGVVRRAAQQQLFELALFNPRDFTEDRHQTVDDRPYGGGPGMVMKVAPLQLALEAAVAAAPSRPKVIYLSPQGQLLKQQQLQACSEMSQPLLFICGRYEGVDERLIDAWVDEEWSVGDYVLSGGELPAMTVIDALVRLIPGALGHENSAQQDSFSDGILDCPHYTRPEVLAGQQVPQVLLSGNHEHIRRWRLQQALGRTWLRRPELLQSQSLNDEQLELLQGFQQQWQQQQRK